MKIINSLFLSLLVFFSNSLFASNAFNFEGYGAVSRSLGGSGSAHNVGVMAMMTNPATLGLMPEGTELHLGFDILFPDIELRNTQTGEKAVSGDRSNNRGPYVAPEMGIVHRFDRLTLGTGIFAQGGAGTEYGDNSFLSRTTTNNIDTGLDISSRILNVEIPFAMAFRLNDHITIGASFDAIWTAANASFLLDASQVGSFIAEGRAGGSLVPMLAGFPAFSGVHIGVTKDEMTGGGVEAWGYAGKLGFTYQILPSTRLAAVYHAKTRVGDLKGKAEVTLIDQFIGQVSMSGPVEIRNFQSPAQFMMGISHQFNQEWTLVADYQRAFWEDVMKDINIGFIDDASGGSIEVSVPLNFPDINIYTIGVEYRPNQQWSFRGGYNDSDQVVATDLLFDILPAHTTSHLTAGFSYHFNRKNKVEFALSHALNNKRRNSKLPNTSKPIESNHSQLNAVIAYVYRF